MVLHRNFPNPAAGYGKLLPAPANFQIPSWLHILGNCLDSNQYRNMHKCNWAVSVARTLWSNWQAWKLHSESWSFNKEIIITIYWQIVPSTENPSPCKQCCPKSWDIRVFISSFSFRRAGRRPSFCLLLSHDLFLLYKQSSNSSNSKKIWEQNKGTV